MTKVTTSGERVVCYWAHSDSWPYCRSVSFSVDHVIWKFMMLQFLHGYYYIDRLGVSVDRHNGISSFTISWLIKQMTNSWYFSSFFKKIGFDISYRDSLHEISKPIFLQGKKKDFFFVNCLLLKFLPIMLGVMLIIIMSGYVLLVNRLFSVWWQVYSFQEFSSANKCLCRPQM